MSPYTAFVSSVLFPLHERLKGHDSVRVRHELEASQWWPRERIAELQLVRLKALLTEVGSQVPFYRRLFAETGFDPAKVGSIDDLRRLPTLDKAQIRAHAEAMKRVGAGPLARSNTGGSSGEPLIFFLGKERVSHDVAAKWRATRWWGVDIGDREAVIWGSPIELKAQDRLRSLRDRLLRTRLLPAFEMSEPRLDAFVDALRQQRPRMLFGYPSALAHIARHAERRGVALDDLGIAVAFVTSERLYDDQRKTIARVFGCPVANGYGGRDAGFIAHECPSGGMHVTMEDVVVELLDPAGQPVAEGEPGEIVVTHLCSRDFPFVRYRTGDVAVADRRRCACGRGLPLLREIQGRSTDFVVAADGTVMHGLALIYVVRDVAGVQSFKIVQESRSRTTVQLVTDAGFGPAQQVRIEQGLRQRLGESVEVNIEIVPRIAAEASGKFRYVVSHASVAVAASHA